MKKQFYNVGVFFLLSVLISDTAAAQFTTLDGKKITAAAFDNFLRKQMDSLGMPGLSIAVISKGRVVCHRAIGLANIETKAPINDQSLFEAASISKPVFAYLVMRMVDKGLLNLDTPLYRYMPYPDIAYDNRYQLITARMALCHETGFPNWRYFEMADTALHIRYGQLYLKFTPGTQFAYSGEGYHYLAQVIAHLTGRTLKTLDALFQQEVAKPLDMQHAWFSGNDYVSAHTVTGHKKGKVAYKKWPTSFPQQDSSTFGAAGGLHTEAISYAHFLIGFMNGKGLTKANLTQIFAPQVQIPKDNTMFTSDGDTAWGLGLGIRPTPYGIIYEHGGNNGNFQSGFIIDRERKTGYVFLTNCDRGADFNKKMSVFIASGNE